MKVKNESGFVGIVFLAIALIGIVIASIASMSRESSSGTAREAIKMDIAIILKHGSDFKLAIDKMVASGGDVNARVYSDNGHIAFLDYPDVDAEIAFKPPSTAMLDPEISDSYYQYTYLTTSITGTEQRHRFFGLYMKSKEHCQMVNNLVNGTQLTAEPPTNMTLSLASEGCYRQSSRYRYFKYILENIPITQT